MSVQSGYFTHFIYPQLPPNKCITIRKSNLFKLCNRPVSDGISILPIYLLIVCNQFRNMIIFNSFND